VSHTDHSAVDLYWLPLGAGGHFVRINGRAYETVAARMARRPACALYHSALEVRLDSERFVIEMAPIFDAPPSSAASSPKGRSAHAGPDAPGCFATASDGGLTDASPTSTRRSTALTDQRAIARRVLDLVAQVPTPVWGRDELQTGGMWNSNSVIAWLVVRSGIDSGLGVGRGEPLSALFDA